MMRIGLRIFSHHRSMQIENFFASNEIRAFHFCKYLKKDCFAKLNEKNITVNKKPASLSFQKQIQYSERINLTEENDSLFTSCEEIAKERNKFFANAVKNLNIPVYENFNSLTHFTNGPTLKIMVK